MFDSYTAARNLSDIGVDYAECRNIQPPNGGRPMSEQQNRYDSYQLKVPINPNRSIQVSRYYAAD